MTCAHGGWTTHNNLEITTKPLSRSNQTYRTYIVDEKVDCDMVLLGVKGIANMEIGKFDTRKLEVRRLLWHMVILMIFSDRVALEIIFTHVLLT
jgi:hypothetical protein